MRPGNVLLVVAALACSTQIAEARRHRSMGGEKYVANGKFGLGLELGAPVGINGKYFLTDDRALNFGLGFIYDRYYYDGRDGTHLYCDYLFHPFSITNTPDFQLPFYIGVGGRIWDFNGVRNNAPDDGFAVGVRVPIGVAFDFNNIPLDVFVQLTFVVDEFFNYDRNDRLGPHLEGSLGVRNWF